MRRRRAPPTRREEEEEEEEEVEVEEVKKAKTTTYTGSTAEKALATVARLLGPDVDAEARAALALLQERIMQADEVANCFLNLPLEVIDRFTQFLDHASFFNWARTCKAMWRIYCDSGTLRRRLRAQGLAVADDDDVQQMVSLAVPRGLYPASASSSFRKVRCCVNGALQFVVVAPRGRVLAVVAKRTYYHASDGQVVFEDMTENRSTGWGSMAARPDFYQLDMDVAYMEEVTLFCCEPVYTADGKLDRVWTAAFGRDPVAMESRMGFYDLDPGGLMQHQQQNVIAAAAGGGGGGGGPGPFPTARPVFATLGGEGAGDFVMKPHAPGAPVYHKGFALCAEPATGVGGMVAPGVQLRDLSKKWSWPRGAHFEANRARIGGRSKLRIRYYWRVSGAPVIFTPSYQHQPVVFPRHLAGSSPNAPLAWYLEDDKVCCVVEDRHSGNAVGFYSVRLPAAAQGAVLTNIGGNSTTLFVVVRKRQANGKAVDRTCMLMARRVDTIHSTWWCACPTFELGPQGNIFVTDYGVALGKDKVLVF